MSSLRVDHLRLSRAIFFIPSHLATPLSLYMGGPGRPNSGQKWFWYKENQIHKLHLIKEFTFKRVGAD